MRRAATTVAAALAAAVTALACMGLAGGDPAEGQEDGRSRTSALVCRVYMTQYDGETRREAALPYAPLEDDGRLVRVERASGAGKAITVQVKETGPWNANDAYWLPEPDRRWKNLPRCVAEAHAAFYRDYNGGRDQFGREVLDPAGIDVTPAVAREMGLRKRQGAWVRVTFPWVRR